MSGDPPIIVQWDNGKYNLRILYIDSLCQRIKQLLATFTSISFSHFYITHNFEVDLLSKTTVDSPKGLLYFEEYVEDASSFKEYVSLLL